MVDLDFDALRPGEAPESYLCDLRDLVVQTVRLCELLYSTRGSNYDQHRPAPIEVFTIAKHCLLFTTKLSVISAIFYSNVCLRGLL
jgi:hypothetical protein